MTPYFLPVIVLASLLSAASASAQNGIERRPCVAPGSPPGCDSTLRGAPEANTSFPEGPRPESRSPALRIPLQRTPDRKPPPAEPDGTVTVGPNPADAKPSAPQPAGPPR